MGQEIFPVMRGRAGMGQEKSMRDGGEDLILRPRPAPLPSLLQAQVVGSSVCPVSCGQFGGNDHTFNGVELSIIECKAVFSDCYLNGLMCLAPLLRLLV